jgi:hypothetical protein
MNINKSIKVLIFVMAGLFILQPGLGIEPATKGDVCIMIYPSPCNSQPTPNHQPPCVEPMGTQDGVIIYPPTACGSTPLPLPPIMPYPIPTSPIPISNL